MARYGRTYVYSHPIKSLPTIQHLNQAATATVTTTSTLVRQIGAIKTATVTTAATLIRALGVIKTATVTTTSTLMRALSATKSAIVTTTSSVIRQIGAIKAATVTTSATVTAVKVKLVTVTATVTTAASVVRQVGKNFAATVTTSGVLQRALGKLFSASVTTTPAMSKQIAKTVAVTVTITSSVIATPHSGSSWDPTVQDWITYIPDEIALSQGATLNVAYIGADLSYPTLDAAPTAEVLGPGGSVLLGATNMTANGNDWVVSYTPTTTGPQALVVRALKGGATLLYTVGFTVRPQFDPLGLAISDVLVSRM